MMNQDIPSPPKRTKLPKGSRLMKETDYIDADGNIVRTETSISSIMIITLLIIAVTFLTINIQIKQDKIETLEKRISLQYDFDRARTLNEMTNMNLTPREWDTLSELEIIQKIKYAN